MGRFKDSAAILPLRVPGLCAPHQSGGCGVPLPAARRAAGAEHAIQRVSAEVSQLTAEAPRTFQQAASGEDAAADAGPQRDTDDVRITLCAADPDLAQRHAVGVVGNGDG